MTRPNDGNPIYLFDMMKRLGIEPGSSADPRVSLSHITAYHRCEACVSKAACRAWLDATAGHETLPPAFCPNADILFQLEIAGPGRHDETPVRLAQI